MEKKQLGATGIDISPVVFGGNVFGWTADEKQSFDLLDAWVDLGFDAIDTADVYSAWAEGNSGGESETIIGKWLAKNPSKRDQVKIFTKVGSKLGEDRGGLSARWVKQGLEDSLKRLQTDYVDLYFTHWPDDSVGYEETLTAFDAAKKEGKIRSVGASNLDLCQLEKAQAAAASAGVQPYQVLQPEYNLYDRDKLEGGLGAYCETHDIGVITYFSLASGFLSGKYRSEADLSGKKRGDFVKKYLGDKGKKVLAALDEVSETVRASQAEVAIAWLIHKSFVTAPIASATSGSQLESLRKAAELKLDANAMTRLDASGVA